MRWIKDVRVWLFVATFLTVSFAGSSFSGLMDFKKPLSIFYGVPFALSLLTILLAHEMGHYVAAKRWGVEVSGPYFIPFPFFLGTFGAFIGIKSPIPNRTALCDIGAAGPWAGIGMAIAILSLVYPFRLELASFVANQARFAILIGFLVTLINLLPSGSLDGGHLIYAFLGGLDRRIVGITMFFSFLLTVMFVAFFNSLISPLVLFILYIIGGGMRHPPTETDSLPLDWKRKVVIVITFILYAALLYGSTFVKFGLK